MNIIIFEDDQNFARLIEQRVTGLGHTVVLITDSLQRLKNHLLFSDFAEVYLLDIYIGDKEEGLRAFTMIQNAAQKHICIFLTNYLDTCTINMDIKIKGFSFIGKQHLNELPLTLKYAEDELRDRNLFIYRSRYKQISITLAEIYYLECQNGRICIYHKEGIFTLRLNKEQIMKKLGNDFKICHRSYIVNRRMIVSRDIKSKELILKNGLRCPYSQQVMKW